MIQINYYHQTTKAILAQVNAHVAPYEVLKVEGKPGKFAVYLGGRRLTAEDNRGKAIDKAFRLKETGER
jgi:hypothetical protein